MRPLLLTLALAACHDQTITAERTRARPEIERAELVIERRGMYVRPPEPIVQGECEDDQTRACLAMPRPLFAGVDYAPPRMRCRHGRWDTDACATPLVVVFDESEHVQFTHAAGSFTIGPYDRTEWVSARTPWLALDADGSGCIEGQDELFGPPPNGTNGFQKLARFDDNHDDVIDARDHAFGDLVLWSDADQDRRCTPRELTRIADAGIDAIPLAYASPRPALSGSYEGEYVSLSIRGRRGRLVDVYLAPLP